MKSKSPFPMKSPLRIQTYGGDTYESPDTVITKTVGEQVGKAITGIAKDATKYMDLKGKLAKDKSDHVKAMELANLKYGKKTSGEARLGLTTPSEVGSSFGEVPGVPDLVSKSQTSSTIKGETFTDQNAWDSNRNDVRNDKRFQGEGGKDRFFIAAQDHRDKKGTGINTTYDKGKTRFEDGKRMLAINMNGSPNKLIGDTMDPYGQINPGAVPPNQAQNDLGAQPIISAEGSQPSARAIDMAAIGNPYATPGADFDPQSKMKAESIFGSPMQRQGLMNLGTPLHHDSEKQAHTHPSKTTTKMKPDGEYPGARYVKGDLVDQDDLLDKTELDAHIATQVQSDKKGTFIKEMPDTGPGSDIETSKGFGKKIRLESMGRSSYTSNMKDQMDPHNFLFKNTPKK